MIFVPAKTPNNKIQVAASWDIEFDEIFEISILGLAKDISNSVYRTNRGYLEMLEKDNSIQDRFENAIESIHATMDILSYSDGKIHHTLGVLLLCSSSDVKVLCYQKQVVSSV